MWEVFFSPEMPVLSAHYSKLEAHWISSKINQYVYYTLKKKKTSENVHVLQRCSKCVFFFFFFCPYTLFKPDGLQYLIFHMWHPWNLRNRKELGDFFHLCSFNNTLGEKKKKNIGIIGSIILLQVNYQRMCSMHIQEDYTICDRIIDSRPYCIIKEKAVPHVIHDVLAW